MKTQRPAPISDQMEESAPTERSSDNHETASAPAQAAAPPPQDPATAASALGTAIRHLVENQQSPSATQVANVLAGAPLPLADALHGNEGFWAAPFWEAKGLDGAAVRHTCDPLRPVIEGLRGRPSEARASTLRQALASLPEHRRYRLLVTPSLRGLLFDDLDALGRERVLGAITDPDVDQAPYELLRRVVANGDPDALRRSMHALIDRLIATTSWQIGGERVER